jgi:FixJ family two-component response regulator
MDNPKVWFIDENQQQSETYADVLRRQFPKNISVETICPPLAKTQDYLRLLNTPEIACFIIDQRLKDTGIANYFGIELALFLRSINTKLPIYILTNFAEDSDAFKEGEWSVEDIIAKSDLANVSSDKSKAIIARILRRIAGYSDYLAERERKFQELLRKTLNGQMSPEDEKELDEIQFDRTSSILAEELPKLQELNKLLEEYKKITDRH